MTTMCTCANGCDRNSMADPGVFPPCHCWCHDEPEPSESLSVEKREYRGPIYTLQEGADKS